MTEKLTPKKSLIFVFTTAYEPFIGGAEIAIREIAKRNTGNFDFVVLTSRFNRELPHEEMREGIFIRRFGFGKPYDKFFFPFFSFLYVFRRIVREWKRPYLFWVVMASYGSFAAVGLKFMFPRAPLVMTLQEGDPEEHLRYARFGLVSFALRLSLMSADTTSAISTYLLRLAYRFGFRGEGKVIPNGVDLSNFTRDIPERELRELRKELGIREEEKIIITTSRLVHKNAIDVVIRALGILKRAHPDFLFQFLVLGTGEKAPFLRALAEKEDVGDRVRLIGALSHKELPKYLKVSDVFIRPSRSEGLGNSFLEAMAAGIPIIGTNAGGIPDFLKDGETGLMCEIENAEDTAEKLYLLLKNEPLRSAMVRNAHAYVTGRYDWEKIAHDFFGLFTYELKKAERPAILIASGGWGRDVGAPALYSRRFAEVFHKRGYRVSVVAYGRWRERGRDDIRVSIVSRMFPSGIRHLLFAAALFWRSRRHDVFFVLDEFSSGLPAFVVAKIWRRKIVLRLGGDFLWESFVNQEGEEVGLPKFHEEYLRKKKLKGKFRIIRLLIGGVLRGADKIIFSSDWQKNLFLLSYPRVPAYRMGVIENPLPRLKKIYTEETLPVILYAGRFIFLKNLYRLIEAFDALSARFPDFELWLMGEGPEREELEEYRETLSAKERIHILRPLPHDELLQVMAQSWVFAFPSFSDITPNSVTDALSLGVSVLCTKETAFVEKFQDGILFFDPLSEEELREKLEFIMDSSHHAEVRQKIRSTAFLHRSWEDAGAEWLDLFGKI
ncbi:MAG: glycosyltransferase family 4 protein [bacterium]|nr:glycosyltransferase family 4 protein [bacterium]